MLSQSKRVTPRVAIEGGQPHTIGRWKELGIFSSHLSALTQTAQLLIFDYACFHEQDNEDQIPVLLLKICSKFFQQLAETPFSHILQWRLYLFQVSRRQLARHQARWSLNRQTVGYRGVNLHIKQIPQLVMLEYQEAYTILHEDLLFDPNSALDLDHDLVPYMLLQAWRLKDDLNLADFRELWVTYPKNAELVQKAKGALLRRIQQDAKLRAMFLIEGKDGVIGFNPKVIDIYETKVQDFLKHLLVLCHITASQPLRELEILSILQRNTAKHRHIMIWEKLVMIFTQYHKGQQQSGTYKENIRFLPKPIRDMLLQYIGLVIPLWQIFLRQRNLKGVISPYLQAELEGKVQLDRTVFKCLTRACARAKIARLHTLNQRHFLAAICKEKFLGKDLATFSNEDITAEDIEDE